MPANIISVIRI